MKKLLLFSLMITAACSFQACNNSSQTRGDSAAAEDSSAVDQEMPAADKQDDSEFMINAAKGGMMEIESGQAASKKGTSEGVKSFGARMVTDHTKASEELKTLAAAKGVTLPATLEEDERKHLDEMSKLTGAEFDKHYMDMMVNDHDKTVNMFVTASQNAKDPDVKAWAAKTLPVLKEHQAAAKAIKSRMDSSTSN